MLLLSAESRPSRGLDGMISAIESQGHCVRTTRQSVRGARPAVVLWGDLHDKDVRGKWTINPLPSIKTSLSRPDAAFTLALHGIPVADEDLPPGAVKRVRQIPKSQFHPVFFHICDLSVLKVEHPYRDDLSVSARTMEQMTEAACRSVYVLGLHFACVKILVHPGGYWYVQQVDPAPVIDDDLGWAYGEKIGQLLKGLESDDHPLDVTLGADPEFVLAAPDGRLMDVSRYVERDGVIGYDRLSRSPRGSRYPIAELRPVPSPSPLVLATNIERALDRATRVLPVRKTKWIAGSYPAGQIPTGGHIHLSGIDLTTPLLKAFDDYLAIPLMLLERRTPAKRRRRRYGRLGDFRRKEHGGFEYRTPSSWLVSPQATKGALALAKVVATEWASLPVDPWQGSYHVREFYLSKKARFRRSFERIWHSIIHTPTGQQYAYELSYIHSMVTSRREWNEELDIKEAW